VEGDDAVAGIGDLDERPGEELAAGGVPPDPHGHRPPASVRRRWLGGAVVARRSRPLGRRAAAVLARPVGDEEPHGGVTFPPPSAPLSIHVPLDLSQAERERRLCGDVCVGAKTMIRGRGAAFYAALFYSTFLVGLAPSAVK
jgi:hypothetical protein